MGGNIFLSILFSIILGGGVLAAEDVRRITVIGAAVIDAAPDTAILTAGVITREKSADATLAQNSKRMNSVLATLAENNIPTADYQTVRLDVQPIWPDDYGQSDVTPMIEGYIVTNLVTVHVREIETLGSVIDAMAAAGANTFQSIGFSISDPRQLFDEARSAAIADARTKAELYARAANVALGDVMYIREPQSHTNTSMVRMQASAPMDTPIAQGQVSIRAEIEIIYAIE